MLIALIIGGCSKELPLDSQSVDPKLVVSGVFKSGKPIAVSLTKSFSLLDDTAGQYVEDAVVELYLNGLFIDQLDHDGKGLYSSDQIATPKTEYIIVAKHSDHGNAEGRTTIPLPISVRYSDSIRVENGLSTVSFELDDPVGKHYYMLRLRGIRDEIIRDSITATPLDSIMDVKDLSLISVEKIFDSDAEVTFSKLGFESFSDQFFEGNTLEFSVRINPDDLIGDFFHTEVTQVILEIRSVSEDYYRFIRSYDHSNPIYGGPFGSFETIYTNISGGFGIIGSMSEKVDTLSFVK